eukprot:scaffold7131_cov63-Phaeocystis_antarctica.AAC.2
MQSPDNTHRTHDGVPQYKLASHQVGTPVLLRCGRLYRCGGGPPPPALHAAALARRRRRLARGRRWPAALAALARPRPTRESLVDLRELPRHSLLESLHDLAQRASVLKAAQLRRCGLGRCVGVGARQRGHLLCEAPYLCADAAEGGGELELERQDGALLLVLVVVLLTLVVLLLTLQVRYTEDAVGRGRGAGLLLGVLLPPHRRLRLAEDGEEHGEQDEDGDEEVDEEEHGVEVAAAVVHDVVDVEVAEERTGERDEGGGLVVEIFHDGAKLHVEHHAEGHHRDDEDDAEEGEVREALAQHGRHQAHLGDEHVGELDDLEQLDAHAEREVELGRARGAHHPPVVAVAGGRAELGAVCGAARLEGLHLPQRVPHEEEDCEVEPVHDVPHV